MSRLDKRYSLTNSCIRAFLKTMPITRLTNSPSHTYLSVFRSKTFIMRIVIDGQVFSTLEINVIRIPAR